MFSLSVPTEEPIIDNFYHYAENDYWNIIDEPFRENDSPPYSAMVCPTCSRQFSSRKTLYRHIRTIHNWPEENVQDLMKKIASSINELELKDGYNNLAWTSSSLSVQNNRRKSKSRILTVPCPVPDCMENLGYHEALANHCQQFHANVGAAGQQQDYRLKEIWHSTFEEFEKWLWALERSTGSSFVKRTTTRNSDIMYRCHRTGNPPMNFKNGIRRNRHQSRKVQSHCTAFIRFRQCEGFCYSVFCEGHILHELDLVKTWLNKSDKVYLKYLLELYSDFEKVLDHIRHERTSDERVYWTTRNDLRNVLSSSSNKERKSVLKSSSVSNINVIYNIHLDHNYCKRNHSIFDHY